MGIGLIECYKSEKICDCNIQKLLLYKRKFRCTRKIQYFVYKSEFCFNCKTLYFDRPFPSL